LIREQQESECEPLETDKTKSKLVPCGEYFIATQFLQVWIIPRLYRFTLKSLLFIPLH